MILSLSLSLYFFPLGSFPFPQGLLLPIILPFKLFRFSKVVTASKNKGGEKATFLLFCNFDPVGEGKLAFPIQILHITVLLTFVCYGPTTTCQVANINPTAEMRTRCRNVR